MGRWWTRLPRRGAKPRGGAVLPELRRGDVPAAEGRAYRLGPFGCRGGHRLAHPNPGADTLPPRAGDQGMAGHGGQAHALGTGAPARLADAEGLAAAGSGGP